MLSPAKHNSSELPEGHPCIGCEVRDLAICGVLDTEDLGIFKRLGCSIDLGDGESLFHQGDPATRVFTVTRGMLKSFRILADGRRQVTGFHMPGDFVGTSVDDEHQFAAEAVGDSRVCAFPVSRFDGFIEEHQPMQRELYIAATRELAQAQQQMVLLGRKTAIERIASFLLLLSERSKGASVVDLPMCRSDISDYLGLTKETVSRVLSDMKRTRTIRLQAIGRVEILDRGRLTSIAVGG